MKGKGRLSAAAASLAAILATVSLLAAAGCGHRSLSREEALEWVSRAYANMAAAGGYRYRAEVSYDFPDLDEATRVRLAAAIPPSLSMEGEVLQSQGDYRQHAVGHSGGERLELYVVNGISYRRLGDGEWTATDMSAWRLNVSGLYFISPEEFRDMLGFAGDTRVVEDAPQRLVIAFDVQGDYLASSLERARSSNPPEDEEAYRSLLTAMEEAGIEVTTYIYRSNGHLERQDVTLRLEDVPLLGTVVIEMRSFFSSYGEEVRIELPPEAEKAAPARG